MLMRGAKGEQHAAEEVTITIKTATMTGSETEIAIETGTVIAIDTLIAIKTYAVRVNRIGTNAKAMDTAAPTNKSSGQVQ